MEQVAPETPPTEAAEEFWLRGQELWLHPMQWWVAWWNAWLVPSVPHPRMHLPAGRRFAVPDPIASAEEQDLFA
jgi:hypothetical protein